GEGEELVELKGDGCSSTGEATVVPAQQFLLIRLDDAAERAVRLACARADFADRGLGRHPLVDQVRREHRPSSAAAGKAVDEDLLALRNLRVDECHELRDLIEGRRGEILDADLLVLEARVLDLERVQPVTFEAHDDRVAHLPQAGEVPLHVRRAREACATAGGSRVVRDLHAASATRRAYST